MRVLARILTCALLLSASFALAQNQDNALQTRLSNDDVVSMVRMGLSADTIIAKIRTMNVSNPNSLSFDTSVEGLKALKAASVPDGVIQVMINPATPQPAVMVQAAAMTMDPNLPPPEVGVYWRDGSRFVMIDGQILSNAKIGGKAGSMFSMGFRGFHWDATLNGPHSTHVIRDRRPVFYLYVPDGASSSDYALLRLNKKGDRREFQIGSLGGKLGGGKAGLKSDREIPIESEHVGIRTYKIKLAQALKPGEYAFFMATGQQVNGTAKAQGSGGAVTGRIYDFSLPE